MRKDHVEYPRHLHHDGQPHRHNVPHRDVQLPSTFQDYSPAETTEFFRSLLANDPTMLPGSLNLHSLTVENFDGHVDGSMVDASTLDLTDGAVPGSSPTPTVTGGLGSLVVKWSAISNPDAVGYEVHVIDAATRAGNAAWATSATTLATKIVGTLAFVRTFPATGAALDYDTVYYVKIVAFDDDGPATAGAEASGSPSRVASGDITANSVTAEKLESVLILGTTIETATVGARVKIDPTGIRLFNSLSTDDTTGVSMIMDAQSGSVSIRGQFDFGADPDNPSRLTNQDVIDIVEQQSGFQTPGFVRSVGQSYSNNGSPTINQSLAGSSTAGNLLVMTVTILKHTGTPQTITSPPASWTLIATNLQGQLRQYIYKYENAPKKTGSGSMTFSSVMGVNDIMRISVGEFSGVQVGDVNSSATGNSTSPSSGVTGAQAQAQNLVWGTLAYAGFASQFTSSDIKLAGSAVTGEGAFNGVSEESNTGTDTVTTLENYYNDTSGLDTTEMVATLTAANDWIASVISFKAKATTGTPDTPDAGKARLYSAANAATKAQLHQIDDAGNANSLALAPSGASYRLEFVSAAINWPSINAHTAATDATPSISGLAVGDLCFIIGYNLPSAPIPKAIIVMTEGVCTVAGQIVVHAFNADSVAVDAANTTYNFLVIHRS